MNITEAVVREAALINMLEIIADESMLERIRGELWCVRNGIDTRGLEDVTMRVYETSDLVNWVLDSGFRNKHDQAAFLLCTMSEIS